MIKLLYNRCVGIYKFGNNTYPRRVGRRSNLGHSFQGKKCVLWAGKYGTYLLTHHSMGQKLCCLTQFPWTNFDFDTTYFTTTPTTNANIWSTSLLYNELWPVTERERVRDRQPICCTVQIIYILFLHYGACGGTNGWGNVLQAARSGVQFLLNKADNHNTFTCQASWNLGALTSWNPQGLYGDCITLFSL